MPEDEVSSSRAVTYWRAAFIVYAIAMTIGSHWPALDLGETVRASDKTIHILAFAGLTILFWQTRWVSKLWLIGLAVLIWAVIDESTQGIPILRRTVSWLDLLASAAGIAIALAGILVVRAMAKSR